MHTVPLDFSISGFMCYYGHVEHTSQLGHDLYWSFFYGACVEVNAIDRRMQKCNVLRGNLNIFLIAPTSFSEVIIPKFPQ